MIICFEWRHQHQRPTLYYLSILVGTVLVSFPQGLRGDRAKVNSSKVVAVTMTAMIDEHGIDNLRSFNQAAEETKANDIGFDIDENDFSSIHAVVDATDHNSHTISVAPSGSHPVRVARQHFGTFHKPHRSKPERTRHPHVAGNASGYERMPGSILQGSTTHVRHSNTTKIAGFKSKVNVDAEVHHQVGARAKHRQSCNGTSTANLTFEDFDSEKSYASPSSLSAANLLDLLGGGALPNNNAMLIAGAIVIGSIIIGVSVYFKREPPKKEADPGYLPKDEPEATPEPGTLTKDIAPTPSVIEPIVEEPKLPDHPKLPDSPTLPDPPALEEPELVDAPASSSGRSLKHAVTKTQMIMKMDPKNCEWLTEDECVQMGLPPLGTKMKRYLEKPPWVWETVDTWVRMPFPWDPIQLQALCHAKGITRRDDFSEHSMPSHLVDAFRSGKSIFGYEKDGNQALERISPVMCVRCFDPKGNALVRASRLKRKDDMSEELKLTSKPEWPGKLCGQPVDPLVDAKNNIIELFQEVTGMDTKELEKFLVMGYGEILMSDADPDKYITVKTRYIRHFIDAKLTGEIPEELSEKLGFAEGCFVVTKNAELGEVDTYEWWDPGKCDEDLRLMGDTTKASQSNHEDFSDSHDGEVNFSFHQAHPWSPDLLEGVLRRHKVNTRPVREMRAEISKRLETGEYELVHKLGDSEPPHIALVRGDGLTFFFPAKAGSKIPVA